MADKIKKAYQSTTSIYDAIMTQSSFIGRLYMKLFWGGVDDNEIAEKLLAYIPKDFAGTILDVPVGTAVFTYQKWKTLSSAQIFCIDYSEEMLLQAEQRLHGCAHITCMQGDVGNLPFAAGTMDMVVSMNGFHVFPDKEKAFHETWRVLKPGGKLLACFYIKGKSDISDWLARTILTAKGLFTPPFYTEQEVETVLAELYTQTELYTDGSMVYFVCTK